MGLAASAPWDIGVEEAIRLIEELEVFDAMLVESIKMFES